MRRAIAWLAGVALVLTGCSSTPAGPSDVASVHLRVGQTGWASAQAALEIAGLANTPYTVEWPVFTGGDKQLQALAGGALDVTQSSEIPPVFAAASGAPKFKVVAVQQGTTLLQEVVVTGGSPLRSIADLKGRKVGYVQNTTAQYFLDKLLEQAGLRWSDITAAPLSPNDGVTALQSGAVDALASYGNSIITAHQRGARTLGSGQDILSGNFAWETSTSALGNASERTAIVDLLARLNRAWAYIRNGHQGEYAQRVADATHQPVDQALRQFTDGEAQRPSVLGPTTPAAIASMQTVADTFTELKALPGKVGVARFWTDELNADLGKAL